jgi:hypothetical protein
VVASKSLVLLSSFGEFIYNPGFVPFSGYHDGDYSVGLSSSIRLEPGPHPNTKTTKRISPAKSFFCIPNLFSGQTSSVQGIGIMFPYLSIVDDITADPSAPVGMTIVFQCWGLTRRIRTALGVKEMGYD